MRMVAPRSSTWAAWAALVARRAPPTATAAAPAARAVRRSGWFALLMGVLRLRANPERNTPRWRRPTFLEESRTRPHWFVDVPRGLASPLRGLRRVGG